MRTDERKIEVEQDIGLFSVAAIFDVSNDTDLDHPTMELISGTVDNKPATDIILGNDRVLATLEDLAWDIYFG